MKKDVYELTNPQKSIWYVEKMYSGTAINNICGSFLIKEKTDLELLRQAINLFVKLNDSFQIRLFLEGSSPREYFTDFKDFDIEIIDIDNENDILEIEKNMVQIPFNLFESPLYTFKLFRMSNGYGGFVVNAHHLISDAATFALIGSEIAKIYENLKNKEDIDLDTRFLP